MKKAKKTLEEINRYLKKLRKKTPTQTRGFYNLLFSIETGKALDKKTKELIAIALSIITHCEWCIVFHVNEAIKAGAKEEEILESIWMAVLMGGGPALMYGQLALKAFEELKKG